MGLEKKFVKRTLPLLGDFYLMEVRFDPQNGLASEFNICEPIDFLPGRPFWVKREDVIHLIEDGFHLELLPPEDLTLPRRWLIRVVEIGGVKYLRSDLQALPADYLIRTEC